MEMPDEKQRQLKESMKKFVRDLFKDGFHPIEILLILKASVESLESAITTTHPGIDLEKIYGKD